MTQLLVQWVPVFLSTVEGRERRVDHSPPSNAEVSNWWSYSYTLLTFLTLRMLVLETTPILGHKCII